MTKPSERASAFGPVPAPRAAPVRPGRKLGPVVRGVSSSHRAWLEPVRDTYLDSGQTLADLSYRVLLAKSKLSELLRGVGLYPRWEVVHRLSAELDMPNWPLYRLWRQAALDAGKPREWIERSTENSAPGPATDRYRPPLEHGALREMVEDDYRFYAQVFLSDKSRDAAVKDTFAILWLHWNTALCSPDIRFFAWSILRTTVMARATYRDGRPELETAVFDTVALRNHTSPADGAAQLAESLELFKAISRLPAAQLDVMVLLHLCGFTAEKASGLLGVPLATVRADERRAGRYLESVVSLPPETEGPTA
ncbi:sigma-70 family RNA polymerase sigma factor [Streptomyces sp. NBC_00654]|uniref:sigma-70 family RNA polymerase sigma factor n=1 Tax=Streptomyces sp. NBC_00654 TaxID=2975799 RepID=UPI00225C079C|nr:sigma-70 family RNA polymerase sigma factor [Streptomyces sp. NBC_00654]MCX4971205.1 sigma-70 family RNA polymerase sigma factor [Streptomyces sp. NBC_00654]MCX4971212.1 sigma-70 family RNA polymerase sigma factor [Streptomyces sp. NBC_00654]